MEEKQPDTRNRLIPLNGMIPSGRGYKTDARGEGDLLVADYREAGSA